MTGNISEGYPLHRAQDIAIEASEELKNILEAAGVQVTVVIAGATGWGQPPYGFPTVGVNLKEEQPDAADISARIMELSEPLIERGIRVTVYPKQ